MNILNKPIEFDWDKGNSGKNLARHKVTDQECEEGYILLGKTKQQRLLFIIFTVRNTKIRVISARDINKKENKLYHE